MLILETTHSLTICSSPSSGGLFRAVLRAMAQFISIGITYSCNLDTTPTQYACTLRTLCLPRVYWNQRNDPDMHWGLGLIGTHRTLSLSNWDMIQFWTTNLILIMGRRRSSSRLPDWPLLERRIAFPDTIKKSVPHPGRKLGAFLLGTAHHQRLLLGRDPNMHIALLLHGTSPGLALNCVTLNAIILRKHVSQHLLCHRFSGVPLFPTMAGTTEFDHVPIPTCAALSHCISRTLGFHSTRSSPGIRGWATPPPSFCGLRLSPRPRAQKGGEGLAQKGPFFRGKNRFG